jgi:hypothetical protein
MHEKRDEEKNGEYAKVEAEPGDDNEYQQANSRGQGGRREIKERSTRGERREASEIFA